MLAGCGSGSSSGSQNAPAAGKETGTESKAETTAEAADSSSAGASGKQTDGKNLPELTTEPLTITLWDISTEDPGKTTMEGAVQRFMDDYPNITINLVHQQNDY